MANWGLSSPSPLGSGASGGEPGQMNPVSAHSSIVRRAGSKSDTNHAFGLAISARRGVISETAINTTKPSGIVTMPGWLNGTMASLADSP